MKEEQNYWTVVLENEYGDMLVHFHDVIASDKDLAINQCKAQMAPSREWFVKRAYLQEYKEGW